MSRQLVELLLANKPVSVAGSKLPAIRAVRAAMAAVTQEQRTSQWNSGQLQAIRTYLAGFWGDLSLPPKRGR